MDRLREYKTQKKSNYFGRWASHLSLEDTPSKKNFGFSEKKIEGGSAKLQFQKSTGTEYRAFFKFLAQQLVLKKLLVRIQPPRKLLFIKGE